MVEDAAEAVGVSEDADAESVNSEEFHEQLAINARKTWLYHNRPLLSEFRQQASSLGNKLPRLAVEVAVGVLCSLWKGGFGDLLCASMLL